MKIFKYPQQQQQKKQIKHDGIRVVEGHWHTVIMIKKMCQVDLGACQFFFLNNFSFHTIFMFPPKVLVII